MWILKHFRKTNADLIQTLDDVMKIQKEGREKRQAAEAEMVRMENDLKTKLLEIQHCYKRGCLKITAPL